MNVGARAAAKPIIDIVMGVADAADERFYVPGLEALGFVGSGTHPRLGSPAIQVLA